MTFNIFKDKGQGHISNAFKPPYLSRYWSYGTGFDMNTYNQRTQNVTMTLKVKFITQVKLNDYTFLSLSLNFVTC